MRKRIGIMLLAAGIALGGCAGAELSTNLKIRTEHNTPVRGTVSETYVDAEGNPAVASDKGYATVRYTYTKGNQIARIELLDAEGNPVNGREGYARIDRKYTMDELTGESYFDAEGNPVNGPEGYARQETKKAHGKWRTTWEYDTEGNPVNNHRITEYYPDGRVKTDSWYDTEDRLTRGPEGYARVEAEYKSSLKSREAFLDENGEPYYYAGAGYATLEREFNGSRVTALYYYGTSGELIPGPEGYAIARYSYNRAGGYRKALFYNADGSLYYTDKGICGVEELTGKGDRVLEEYYYTGEDRRGKSRDGYGGVIRKYSEYGILGSERYVDENDQPMTVKELGYHQVKNTVFDRSYISETAYLGTAGEYVLNPEGYALVRYQYVNHHLTGVTYYGTDGKTPVSTAAGYARVAYERNAEGKETRTNWYDADGNPVRGEAGAEEVRNEWDGEDKTLESYWKADGTPVNGREGYHELRLEYNGQGQITRQAFYNKAGEPMAAGNGVAAAEIEYNSRGEKMCVRYYDRDGALMLTPGQEYAFVRTALLQDLEGEDPEGAADGRRVEYYGTDGKLMNLKAGYACIIRRMNAAGQVTKESYFTADGKPAELAAGYDTVRILYNSLGQAVQTEYLSGGALKENSYGVAAIQRAYDGQGNVTAEWYLNAECEATIHGKNGYHRVEKTYLDAKHVTSEAWFDPWGKPMSTGDTYVKVEREFDRRGNILREVTLDENGDPVARKAGYDEVRQTVDGNNRVIRTGYYLGGEPVLAANGIAAFERTYDGKGLVASEAYDTRFRRKPQVPRTLPLLYEKNGAVIITVP